MLGSFFGLLRPGRVLELAGVLAGLCREGLVAALGLASVPGGLWCFEDGVLEVSPVLFEVIAPRVSRLAGWPEAEVLAALDEGHRASAVFRGLLRAGFELRSALEAFLRSCGQFPSCSDPVLLWFFGELSGGACLEHVCSGRVVDPPRDVSSVWGRVSDGVLVDVALRYVSEVGVRFGPFRVELLPLGGARLCVVWDN